MRPVRNRVEHDLGVLRAVLTVVVSAAIGLIWSGFSATAQETTSTAYENTQTSPNNELQTPLSASEQSAAKAWELTDTEWRRYRQLMLGIRGSVSDERLSPIEVLGIHARDPAERRRYAERWAQAMRADAERVLAFQHAYDAAAEDLFADQPLIDAGRLKAVPKTTSALKAGDRVLMFATIDCPACEAMLAKLLSHLNTVAGIDIYFTDLAEGHEARIRAWAGERGIEPGWVRGRRVTLNVDNGLLVSLSGDNEDAPALFVRRGEQVSRLAYAEL